MKCRIAGVGLLGPGLPGWEASRAALTGEAPWKPEPVALPPPPALPATERRRTSASVRLALAAAGEAAAASGLPAAELETVFASSNGDGAVVGSILDALSTGDGAISPTQFHNSVHNAAAGYWGIAAGSTRASVSLGGHDDSFPSGLMQAVAAVVARGVPVLFCAYDAPLPLPLHAHRRTEAPFAAALVLVPEAHGAGTPLAVELAEAAEEGSAGALASLVAGNPAARALPLLRALAAGHAARIGLPLADGGAVVLELGTP
ncbi:beta-ketoacyl synthase chain length factor [Pararoseomonas indoligenes]|uniref:Beta-ketoacyl synthase chain length factor n=1 Tax=Roseomonas indoligenes TaxID=2820811 RepID=A0A940N2Q0_9PROT|nr:beta-ketoacyl synthase chain length factor [Pararoseomonas indoligenes]MBP0495647.1 beta-ketoacyl synthase chain length factor [Pararoseomonas indoligenes]